jgi:plastocyanin
MSSHLQRTLAAAALLAAAGTGCAQAAQLTLQLKSAADAAVEDVVVYLLPVRPAAALPPPEAARIDQVDKTFVPLISVVQTGTRVSFPNRDNIRHHVYSFSAPKRFEIKLYADTPSMPILFDKAGYVVMGCNIHDHMIAHLLVVDTRWFAITDARGAARIVDVPAGDYTLVVWHYMRPDKQALTMPLNLKADMTQTLTLPARPAD